MKATNKWQIPEHVVRLCPQSYKPKSDRISVSALIDSPRIRTLQIEKWDEIERDIAVSLTSLGGISLHQRAESFAETDELAEQKLEDSKDSQENPLGLVLVGKADVYNNQTKQIRDWKSMGCYGLAFIDKIKKMTAQLNCYAWQKLMRQQIVESLWLDIYWKNWKYEEYQRATDKLNAVSFDLTNGGVLKGYPPIPYSQVKLPLWTFDQQEQYIKDQIHYHLTTPMDCNDRWPKADEWAVMKEGRKSALRVLDTYEKATNWCLENILIELPKQGYYLKKGISIVKREGKCIRCGAEGFYCPVWNCCPDAIKD